jgi:hypothetical protein
MCKTKINACISVKMKKCIYNLSVCQNLDKCKQKKILFKINNLPSCVQHVSHSLTSHKDSSSVVSSITASGHYRQIHISWFTSIKTSLWSFFIAHVPSSSTFLTFFFVRFSCSDPLMFWFSSAIAKFYSYEPLLKIVAFCVLIVFHF